MIAHILGVVLIAWAYSSSAYGQDSQPPFPREEASRLSADIRKTPDNHQLRRDLIDLLREHGLRLKSLSEGHSKLIVQAATLMDSGKSADLERAIRLYHRVADAVPWHVQTYMDLGLAYDQAGNWAQAKRYYELFLYAGKDYSMVPAELSIIQEALERVTTEMSAVAGRGGRPPQRE